MAIPSAQRSCDRSGPDGVQGTDHSLHIQPGWVCACLLILRYRSVRIRTPSPERRGPDLEISPLLRTVRIHRLPATPDRVREAIRRIVEEMGMSPRRLTVSTVGLVPGMLKLAEEPWQLNLAVSLHAAVDDLRDSLVPINKR